MAAFDEHELTNMVAVGLTDHRSARIWVRAAVPGPHRLEIQPDGEGELRTVEMRVPEDPTFDGTVSLCYPDDFEDGSPLQADTGYRLRVLRRDGTEVGTARLRTAPDGRGEGQVDFHLGFMSCHQPFDDDGELTGAATRSLAVLEPAFRDRNVRRIVLMGDQMYADWPPSRSLFNPEYLRTVAPEGRSSILDCSREEVRALLQQRHRIFWQTPEFTRVQAMAPTTCMLDDHEIRDNFGTAPEHWSPEWENVREGAFLAFDDYQGLRFHGRTPGRPSSFHHGFTYGPVALFVMDLRTQKRCVDDRIDIYSDDQHQALAEFMEAHADHPVLVLVVTVPVVHIPDWVARAADKAQGRASDAEDRWVHPKAEHSRRKLMGLIVEHLTRHPEQRLLLVGGDIHAGMVARLTFRDMDLPPVYQLVSSAVTNLEGAFVRAVSGQGPRMVRTVRSPEGIPDLDVEIADDGRGMNPFSGLNVGFIRVHGDVERPGITLELLSHDDGDPPRPRSVFHQVLPPLEDEPRGRQS